MSYGWLAPRADIVRERSWFGVELDPTLKTRWEELTFARDALASVEPGYVLDAGCGFEPGVHVMPEISAGLGWHVEALDLKRQSGFVPDPLINRRMLDMSATDYPDAWFDAYVSVSVLEHLSPGQRDRALAEAMRVLRPGGLFIATMDAVWPKIDLPCEFGDPAVPAVPLLTVTNAPVAFMSGVRQ